MHSIHSLVRWFCSQLTREELCEALSLLLEVFDGRLRKAGIVLVSAVVEAHAASLLVLGPDRAALLRAIRSVPDEENCSRHETLN